MLWKMRPICVSVDALCFALVRTIFQDVSGITHADVQLTSHAVNKRYANVSWTQRMMMLGATWFVQIHTKKCKFRWEQLSTHKGCIKTSVFVNVCVSVFICILLFFSNSKRCGFVPLCCTTICWCVCVGGVITIPGNLGPRSRSVLAGSWTPVDSTLWIWTVLEDSLWGIKTF